MDYQPTTYDIGVIFDPQDPRSEPQTYELLGTPDRAKAVARCKELNNLWKEFPWCRFTTLNRGYVEIPFEGIRIEGLASREEIGGEEPDDPYDLFTEEEQAHIERRNDDEDGQDKIIDVSNHPF